MPELCELHIRVCSAKVYQMFVFGTYHKRGSNENPPLKQTRMADFIAVYDQHYYYQPRKKKASNNQSHSVVINC